MALIAARRCSQSNKAALVELRCSGSRRKCRFARSLRMVPQAAMPMAPPRLRIRLNRPEASFSRSGGRPPRVSVTTGATANIWEKPRNACGSSNSRQPQSCVIGAKFHMLSKAGEPGHHQPTQVDAPREECIDRNAEDLKHAGREHVETDLERAEPANAGEEHRRKKDRRENPDTGDKGAMRSGGSVAQARRTFALEAARPRPHRLLT